jgi:hypothetical protein
MGSPKRKYFTWIRNRFSPIHPTCQSRKSKSRVLDFLSEEQMRSPDGFRLNVGSGGRRFGIKAFNLDICLGEETDVQGDLLNLPIKNGTIDAIVCTGVWSISATRLKRLMKFLKS